MALCSVCPPEERKLDHPLTMTEYANFTEFLKAERPICPSSRCDPDGRSLTLPNHYYNIWHHDRCCYNQVAADEAWAAAKRLLARTLELHRG